MPSTLTLIGDTFQPRIGIWKKKMWQTTQDTYNLLPRHLNEKLCSKNSLSFSFKTARKRGVVAPVQLTYYPFIKFDFDYMCTCLLSQIVARVLQPQGVTVGIVNVAESIELAQSMGGYPFNLYVIYNVLKLILYNN